MSEATFTFRVEDNLKAAFADAAQKKDRTAAQLLRDFMREYVAQTEEDTEYDAWFRRKVEAGERAYREGRFISQKEATAKAKQRQARLLAGAEKQWG
jgi:predicted transcriptional regulator